MRAHSGDDKVEVGHIQVMIGRGSLRPPFWRQRPPNPSRAAVPYLYKPAQDTVDPDVEDHELGGPPGQADDEGVIGVSLRPEGGQHGRDEERHRAGPQEDGRRAGRPEEVVEGAGGEEGQEVGDRDLRGAGEEGGVL